MFFAVAGVAAFGAGDVEEIITDNIGGGVVALIGKDNNKKDVHIQRLLQASGEKIGYPTNIGTTIVPHQQLPH